jgi:hypothetical protein
VCSLLSALANPTINVQLRFYSRALAWQWMQTNWTLLVERYGGGQFMLARLMSSTLAGFATQERLTEVKKFFE